MHSDSWKQINGFLSTSGHNIKDSFIKQCKGYTLNDVREAGSIQKRIEVEKDFIENYVGITEHVVDKGFSFDAIKDIGWDGFIKPSIKDGMTDTIFKEKKKTKKIEEEQLLQKDKREETENAGTDRIDENTIERFGAGLGMGIAGVLENNQNQGIGVDGDSQVESDRTGESGTDLPKAFQQEKFNSTYEERIIQTPSENNKIVKFKNHELRGESKCTLKPPPDAELQKILDEAGIDGIEYRNAVPDFSPVSKLELEGIDMVNGRTGAKGTYTQANSRVAEMLNNSLELVAEFGISPKNGKKFTASDVSKYMADNKLTWHELNDLTTVQMVPTKVNSTFGHLGGISEATK